MRLELLRLHEFRNFEQSTFSPLGSMNVIHGLNGSGKTSVLEAIYNLGFGRSFRTQQGRQIVREGADAFTVFAELSGQIENNRVNHRVGFQRQRNGETSIRIDGDIEPRFSELARLLPVQLITPESVELVTGGPKLRRQYMDWGLFHVEHSSRSQWQGFARLLKQRNALLRQGEYHKQGGKYWDGQLAAEGERLAAAREAYIQALNEGLNSFCSLFLPEFDFRFEVLPGWNANAETLAEALARKLEIDVKQGFTSVGPQKAEWQIKADGADARERLSRGQLKLLVAALRLVQGKHYSVAQNQACIYLVDDLPAELDQENQRKLCHALVDEDAQVFITAIDKASVMKHLDDADTQLFHVEHGTIHDK